MIKKRLSTRYLCLFYRQMAVLLSSGLQLGEALDVLKPDNKNPGLTQVMDWMKNEWRKTGSVPKRPAGVPYFFMPDFIRSLKEEVDGKRLAVVFRQVADEIEKWDKLRSGILKAGLLPMLTICVSIAVLILILFYFIPVVNAMFNDFGARLPLVTQLLMLAGNGAKAHWGVLAGITGVFFLVCIMLIAMPEYRHLLCRIPVMGKLIRHVCILKFLRCFTMTLSLGIAPGKALTTAASENFLFKCRVETAGGMPKETKGIRQWAEQTGLFPGVVLQAFKAGESAGDVSSILEDITRYYEKDVEILSKRFATLLHAGLLLSAGLMTGWIVLAVYTPIFTMAGALQ